VKKGDDSRSFFSGIGLVKIFTQGGKNVLIGHTSKVNDTDHDEK
jgi:D-lyxose ketol-isomerase